MVPLTFLLSGPGRALIGVAAGLVLCAGLYLYGHHRGYVAATTDFEAARAEALAQHVKELNDEIARSQAAAKQHDADIIRLRKYIASLRGATVVLRECGNPPADFVSLHDMAVSAVPTDRVPTPSSQLACTPGTARYDQVAGVIIDNYEKCSSCQAQLNALIDYLEKK